MKKNNFMKVAGAIFLAMLTVMPLSACSMRDARALVDGQDGSTGLHFDSPFKDLPDKPDLSTGADHKASNQMGTGVGSGSAKKNSQQKLNSTK